MKKGAVAFLDILGFKGIWSSREEEEILKSLFEVQSIVASRSRIPPKDSGWPSVGEPNVTILSDTIVITMESDHQASLLLLAEIVTDVIRHFLRSGLMLRGAIGWGEFTQRGNVFLGPAIDDTAAWHEATDWVGVIATPVTSFSIDRLSNINFAWEGKPLPAYVRYDVPLKGEKKTNLHALNWPGFLQCGYPSDSGKTVRQLMTKIFSEQQPFDASVLKKYDNTLEFIDRIASAT